MINFLPPKEKARISMEKINKIAIIYWFLIFFFLLCFILTLFSIRGYFKSQAIAQVAKVEEIKRQLEAEKIKEIKNALEFANQEIANQNEFFKDYFYFSEILEMISYILPKNIRLEGVRIDFSDNNKDPDIFISGFSLKRSDLITLKENLEKEKLFLDVAFPPSNWVKAENINFSVSFKAKKW